MSAEETIKAGTWVEITQVVLPAGRRPDNTPDDTRRTDLVLKVHGFLLDSGRVGDTVKVQTLAERELAGILTDSHPRFAHDFGEPVQELIEVGAEVRRELRGILQAQQQGGDR